MNARDHGLAQSVAADEPAITAPASPPRRDPVQDADPSFTRKRPRLDSGSNSLRAMSADLESLATSATSSHDQLVEMTIRSHPPSSPAQPEPTQDHSPQNPTPNDFCEDLQHTQLNSPILISNTEDELDSPPIMLVEDDNDPVAAFEIQPDADDHFRRFPFSAHGNYSQVVRELPQYIQGSVPLDSQLLPLLTDWLLDLPDPSVDIQGFYISKAVFWEDFSIVVNKLLQKRVPFGDQFNDDVLTVTLFYRFLSAYVRVCSFLIDIDARLLARPRSDELYHLPLLSQKHMRLLYNILRTEKTPVFHILHKEYGADLRDIGIQLHKDFLKANGAQHLFRLADRLFRQVIPKLQEYYATFISQLLGTIGWTIVELPGADAYMPRTDFYRGTLRFYQKYCVDIQDPSKATDSGVARDLITFFSSLLSDLCNWDEEIADELMDQLTDFGEPDSPTSLPSPTSPMSTEFNDYRQDPGCFPALVMNAWKFKVLRRYIVKGNMALRVMSIAIMDAALVEIWREYNNTQSLGRHPVMQYLADFLLQGQVVDYIVSVDSHPQLISRSGNIVGFLVVTHRWSDKQADSIWKTISTSTDSRVVAATMTMLRGIIGLMKPAHHLYLCLKLNELPIDRYTLDILRFLRELTLKLTDGLDHVNYSERGPSAHPWNVCIRMLRETAPCKASDKNLMELHTEATDQFRYVINSIPTDERHKILQESTQDIVNRSASATGSVRVFYMIALSFYPIDVSFFQQNQDLIRSILEELPSFVQAEAKADPYHCQMQALHYRLELLRLIIGHDTMTIPKDLYKGLWDHIIGEHALSNEARDLAWTQLLHAVHSSPDNNFCKQLVLEFIPTMDASLYTTGMFEFVAGSSFPITRQKVQTDDVEDLLLQIPGADLLWPIILTAPAGTIEDRAARLLAVRYVKIVEDEGIMLTEVEDAHVALVKRCMNELRSTLEALPKEGIKPEDTKAETRFGRILLFMKLLLEFIRQKPEFNRGRRVDSKADAMDTDIPFGDAITIRYQCGNERQSVTMASDHNLDDLYKRLCHATGYNKINLFAKGQRLLISDHVGLSISDMDFGGQIIVQRAGGAEATRTLSAYTKGSSVFETTIMEHFDELFAWMDSASTASRLLFDFLSYIPAPATFAENVAKGDAASEDLFPPGKVFQARYAAQTLQSRLREQIRNSTLNEQFLSNAVQLLGKALLDTSLISDSIDSHQELQLAAVLVGVMLEFIRERPSSEISAGYFPDGSSLVDRLLKITSLSSANPDFTVSAHDAYATILEACLHSRGVWEAFRNHPELQCIHKTLLLSQHNQLLREQTARKILSICGGDLPSTCPITKAETASGFWGIISSLIPDVVHYPEQSQQLLEIAAQVFRTHDEYDRNEEALRSFLSHWSRLILDHEHQEFAGREEVDYVVFGLTKLLLCCILSLKSFKKPVNAGPLMAQIFKKYIFVTSIKEGGMQTDQTLPILESHSRQELYDLVLALADDRNTYDMLLQLVSEVETGDVDAMCTVLVDRTLDIRSSTGYVGLFNPRAICYMNSLMTQLFMNEEFRRFMLSIELKDPANSQRLLFETQKLFAHMQNSYRRAADPRDFAACVKSLDKTPIDITVQMDADEFYNLLFDQWEAQLFKQEHKQKFRSFYGGQTLNQIKSKECRHVSERTEPFFAVQCDVQGKANLHESLQAYVQGDVMEGDNKYKCESCDGKFVDAVKRTCLKDAPDNLIFHLKRFEFDLNDFSRRKIYDHFAFPESFDISPYKADYLADPSKPRQEDMFDLVGVLVHTGTCENGHYYSYIRERPGSEGNAASTWIEFNDSDVGPFNPADIADRAFGGLTDSEAYGRQAKQYSAYMLFYQRRTAVETEKREWFTPASIDAPKVQVPKFLEEAIDIDNESFIREYCLLDPVHARFLRKLHGASRTVNHGTCSEEHLQETRALHIVLAHLSYFAWRQHSADVFLELLPQLRRSILMCSTCCVIALKWLAADAYAITNILVKCPHPKIRSQMRALLLDSLKYLREQEPLLYGLDTGDSDMELESLVSTTSGNILATVVRRLRITANETSECTRGWDDYYLTLTQLAELGQFETATLLNDSFLYFCLRLFTLHAPLRDRVENELSRIMGKRKAIFNRLIGFTWKLLSSTDLRLLPISENEAHDRQSTFDQEYMKFPLTKKEKNTLVMWSDELKSIVTLDKMLELFDDTKVEQFYPGDMVKWMLQSPEDLIQASLLRALDYGIAMDPPYGDPFIRVALPYCEACTRPESISRVILNVAKAVASPTRTGDDHLPNGEVVLGFFVGLMTLESHVLFELKHPHAFHQLLMARSPMYGIPLLCHYDDLVRKATQSFFQELYSSTEAFPPETLQMKYTSMRSLLPEMINKIVYEKEVGRQRSFLMPIIETCRLFVQQLFFLTQTPDPEAQIYKSPNDTALIYQYQQEIEARLRLWPHDEDTPLSTVDTLMDSNTERPSGTDSKPKHEDLAQGPSVNKSVHLDTFPNF